MRAAGREHRVVRLDNVSKRYGAHVALHPLTLEITRGTTIALIGASGCGKSTLLRMIVGLVAPDTGRVAVDGETVTAASVDRIRHRIGYVIQEGGLFPHLTCERNVALLARYLGWSEARRQERLDELRGLVAMPADMLGRFPQQLSGGQRQRVSLMRALMLDPPLLLLDEPLGALDPVTRYELQDELKAIFERLEKTVVMVTHDMGEAAFFARDIAMMHEGRIVQRGTVRELLEQPAEPYIARFVRSQRFPA